MKSIPDGSVITITAAEAIAAKRFIGFDGKYCAANAKALGVSEIDTDIFGELAIRIKGIAIVEAAGPIASGAAVKAITGGKAIAANDLTINITPTVEATITASGTIPQGETTVTSTSASPIVTVNAEAEVQAAAEATISGSVLAEKINGYALDAATADGDMIRVLLV